MSSLTVILPVMGTLAAAGVAGSVALYIKRIERLNAAELRYSEIRENAYERYLAACDRAWHLRVKACVDGRKDIEPPPKEEIEPIERAVVQQAEGAVEDLQRYSRNFEKAAPALLNLHDEAFLRRRLTPIRFEAARVAVQELERQEAGLRKELGLVRKASIREELVMRHKLRRVMGSVSAYRLVDHQGEDEAILYQGDGEAIWNLVMQNVREWEELEKSVALQESRAIRWKNAGLWPELFPGCL